MRSVVMGLGAHLPKRVMTNKEFEALVDTNDEWIRERTGIHQRHIAAKDERTSDLATEAAKQALIDAGITANDIDLIVLATTTPDETMPSTATRVQHKLGMTVGAAFDVNAACSGFVYAMTVANSMLVSGQAKRALVIGAETYSRILDWKDRGTCILFGDGAGALVLEAQDDEKAKDRGVLYCELNSDGQYGDLLATSGGVSATQTAGMLYMNGREIFRHAVAKMCQSVEGSLKKLSLTTDDIDLLVPHQANWRILASVANKVALPEEKVISTVSQHANTSAASIPLALSVAKTQGKLGQGRLIIFTALGAGLTWGSCVIRW